MVTLRNHRKNGELFLNRLSIRPLVGRENSVIDYLGVQCDITDQVRTHEALEKLQFELEQQAGG